MTTVNRLIIIRADNRISINGEGYVIDSEKMSCFDNLDWIEGYQNTWGTFHALQWYGNPDDEESYGEFEFTKAVPNLRLESLDQFTQAITLWEESKKVEEERIAELEDQERKKQEALEAELAAFDEYDLESLLADL